MKRLLVHPNRRFLQREDGSPFFYLGDTAWELFHRASLDEADVYLRKRAAQGFTVVQAVVLAEIQGLETPNANGDLPLFDNDPTKPNESYFRHVDAIVHRANELGLVIAMLPTWADKVNRMWGGGPEIFDEANARVYAEFLRDRFRGADLIWVLGGDRAVENDRILGIWRSMAAGLEDEHLRTFHPNGGHASGQWLQEEAWLDFNMIQSGHHARNIDNAAMIDADYARKPTKPCMEAESAYEDHPVNWNPSREGWFTDAEVRHPAYRSVFAGGHGVTYGCHDIWQMWQPGREPIAWARTPWPQALDLLVANQMRHLKDLMISRPFFERVPNQSLISGDPGRNRATSGTGYAFVYLPEGGQVKVHQGELTTASWFDPRTGETQPAAEMETFTAPSEEDWVLALDDPAAGFSPPGR